METKGLTLKQIGEQLVHLKSAADSIMKAHAAGAEIDPPDELEDARVELLGEVLERAVAVFVDMNLKLETVHLRGASEPSPALGETNEAVLCSLFKAADVDREALDQILAAAREQVKMGIWQANADELRAERRAAAGTVAKSAALRDRVERWNLEDSEIEILEHAIELVAFDASAELKAQVARLGEKLTRVLAPAAADVERIDFHEVDLKVAVAALAAYRAPWKGGAGDEHRAVLDRLGVKLAQHLGQLQHRAALAHAARPSAPTSLAEVKAAVADPSIPVPGVTPCGNGQHFTDVGAYQCRCGELKYAEPFMVTMLPDGSIVE